MSKVNIKNNVNSQYEEKMSVVKYKVNSEV